MEGFSLRVTFASDDILGLTYEELEQDVRKSPLVKKEPDFTPLYIFINFYLRFEFHDNNRANKVFRFF